MSAASWRRPVALAVLSYKTLHGRNRAGGISAAAEPAASHMSPRSALMHRTVNSLSVSALLLTLLGIATGAPGRNRDLTEDEARRLVIAAQSPSARKLPKLGVDFNNEFDKPDFYKFDVTWDNPKGSVVVGFFAVHRVTGEVWKLVICKRMSSPDLRSLQQTLRRRISLNKREVKE